MHFYLFNLDSTATNYILQLKMMNKGRYFKNCLDIDVTKEKGYFYGKHTFPTEVFARCLGMWSDSVESYFITVLRNQSRNCTCPASQNERESKCKILCARKQGRKTTSYNFNFIRGEYS